MKQTIIFFSCFIAFIVHAQPLSNQLKHHRSPYLEMHGDDPVAWQEWNPQVFARAKKENKLLFVSSGYFSCHWCHVMQRESYQDPVIAGWLNQYFIPVKVDRELNPSLDNRLIDFVEKTRGYAGWPLNVFITPQGYPLVGVVYLPRNDLVSLLENIDNEWKAKGQTLAKVAMQASRELDSSADSRIAAVTQAYVARLASALVEQAFSQADEMQGGFGEQSKFPMVPQLDILLDIYHRKPEPGLEQFLRLTLDSMARQGLRDQLGGGFFRYAVDPGWQLPHFEKMLYDNALLAELYFKAARVFREPLYENVGRETLDFILQQMSDGSNAYIASFSAIDNNNVEGGYYLWREEDLHNLLDKEELDVAKLAWKIQGAAELQAGHHLVLGMTGEEIARQLKLSHDKVSQILTSARSKMLIARKQRQLPRDNKKVAAWNGLLLSALVAASKTSKGKKYEQPAKKLRNYILKNFWAGGQLYRAVSGEKLGKASLEDAACLSRGLLDWANYTRSAADLRIVIKLVKSSWEWFYSPHGWQQNREPLLQYKRFSPALLDGPIPSPSATLAETTMLLAKALNDQAMLAKVKQHAEKIAKEINENPFWYASYWRVYTGLVTD